MSAIDSREVSVAFGSSTDEPGAVVAAPSGSDHLCGPACLDSGCGPCVAQLSSAADRLVALRHAVEEEDEPLVTLTHLLHLCRDEHRQLWERVNEPPSRARFALVQNALAALLPAGAIGPDLDGSLRRAMSDALEPNDNVPPVVVAHALAQFIDDHYGHTFAGSFRRRSPYQPGVGDPIPLGGPDLRTVMDMRPTSPPWRLANRLDETRRIRLAGEWAVQFRVVFDYSLVETMSGLITAQTLIATCHPNQALSDFELPADPTQPTFPVSPADLDRQRERINDLVGKATAAGASIVVLPELCVTKALADEMQDWVRRPDGPQLLVAGSYHHADEYPVDFPQRRRNTAIAWVRGHARPLIHDKHSPAERPVREDIQPQGWPELRVYVTADGWHVVIAICRDLLNPQAVHALSEAGVNLVLVPAMSETLVPFGGPAAQVVGSNQALVAIANNPADWSDDTGTAAPVARALFGHPGLGQQTRLVASADAEPGVAILTVRSAQISWLTTESPEPATGIGQPRPAQARPEWIERLATRIRADQPPGQRGIHPAALRPAAVLVLLSDGPTGPVVLLTERAADLRDYPGQLVFPGGAADPQDDGPVANALREAQEEVGLDPDDVYILGVLPALALPESGFLVTPVLAYCARPVLGASNLAEVRRTCHIPVRELAARHRPHDRNGAPVAQRAGGLDLTRLGRMTATVCDMLVAQAEDLWESDSRQSVDIASVQPGSDTQA